MFFCCCLKLSMRTIYKDICQYLLFRVFQRDIKFFSLLCSACSIFEEVLYIKMNGKNAKCFDFSCGKFHGLRGERGNH